MNRYANGIHLGANSSRYCSYSPFIPVLVCFCLIMYIMSFIWSGLQIHVFVTSFFSIVHIRYSFHYANITATLLF